MIRPLPPFTVRPSKRLVVRKSAPASAIADLARELEFSPVKAARRPMKADCGHATRRLKVLGRAGGAD